MAKVMLVLFLIFPLLSQSQAQAQARATTTYKEITFDLQKQSFVELDQAMQKAMALCQPPPPRSTAADAALKGSLVSLILALTDGLKARRSLLSFDDGGQAMQPPPARLITVGFMNKNQSFVMLRQPPPPTSIVLDAAEADALKESFVSFMLALTDGLKARRSLHNYGEEEPAASIVA